MNIILPQEARELCPIVDINKELQAVNLLVRSAALDYKNYITYQEYRSDKHKISLFNYLQKIGYIVKDHSHFISISWE